MGASCCRMTRDYDNESTKPTCCTSGYWISLRLQPARNQAPSARRSRNQILSSNRDVGYTQRVHNEQLTRPSKIDPARAQEEPFTAVTVDGSTKQEGGPFNIINCNSQKNPSSDCKLEAPDTCEKPMTCDPLLPIADDEEFCPTCLDGYDEDNPKIITRCKHHYHMSCILEWMERSDTCPICDQDMIIDEAC